MRRAALVHPHLEIAEALSERAARPGVIEVDVGEGENPRRAMLERRQQLIEAAAWPGVHDHVVDDPCAYDLRMPQVQQVDELRFACGCECLGHERLGDCVTQPPSE